MATHDAAGTDYSSGGDVAPGLRNRPWYERADASGLPASLRQDRVKYLQALAGRADDGQDVSEWARFSAETMGVVAELPKPYVHEARFVRHEPNETLNGNVFYSR